MINDLTRNNEVVILKQVELDSTIIKLRSDGIVQFDLRNRDDFSVDDLKEINAAVGILGDQKPYPLLINVKHFLNADNELRTYAASEESNRYTIADAFVVNSMAVKFIGNFYISFNKPSRPTKIFDSETTAVEWLKTFL